MLKPLSDVLQLFRPLDPNAELLEAELVVAVDVPPQEVCLYGIVGVLFDAQPAVPVPVTQIKEPASRG